MKPKRFLGGYIVKVCPWKNHEFETDDPSRVYCSIGHKKQENERRRRERIYASRETLPISSKPGASYNLRIREVREAPIVMTKSPEPVVQYYKKLPVRAMSNFQSTYNAQLPSLDDGACAHGRVGDCFECWLS